MYSSSMCFFFSKVTKNEGIPLQLKEFDFCGALESLRLCQGLSGTEQQTMSQRRITVKDHEMGKEALQLTELHGHFGHRYTNIKTSGLTQYIRQNPMVYLHCGDTT